MKKAFCLVSAVLCLCFSLRVSALNTSARSAILLNGDTGEVIYGQNEDIRLPMASTTKIMTALLLCENGDFEREITVTAEMLRVEGSSMGLLAGDRVTLHDLLYGMLLASGNDAASVTAYALGGTVDGFVKMMNSRAAELGLKNTHFETPSGLDGAEHYTTAYDLAFLARYALQNRDFAKAAATESAVLCYGNPPYRRTVTNHNKLLQSLDGAVGVKTGYTKKAGRCLVSAARRDGKFLIAVTLNDPNDWEDHRAMLEYGFSRLTSVELNPEGECYSVAVVGGNEAYVSVYAEPLSIGIADSGGIECEIRLPKFVYAPIDKGEAVGTVLYKKNGNTVAVCELCAETDVKASENNKNTVNALTENIRCIFNGIWEK